MVPKFVILPSAPSMIFEMVVVLTSFFLLNMYIIYLASYDSEFKPNFGMLLNFMFENQTSLNNFKTYVKNVSMDEASKKKESFSIMNRTDNLFTSIVFYWKRTFLKLFVKGKKISTVKTI